MKIKKIATLLASVAVVFSTAVAFATSVSAEIKPEYSVQVTNVNDYGYAEINFALNVGEDLKVSPGVPPIFYAGKALVGAELRMNLNEKIFDKSTAVGAVGGASHNSNLDFTICLFSWSNEFTNKKEGSSFDLGTLWVMPTKEYAGKTAEELNAMDFATVFYTDCVIGEWNNVAATSCDQVSYPSTAVVGKPAPAVVPEVDVTGAFQTTDANWIAEYGKTIYWGVEFKNGGFNGTAIAKIFNEAGTERELEIKAAPEAEVNGNATFGVFTVLGDKTDALKLTVTSGTVTDTADAFVAAE